MPKRLTRDDASATATYTKFIAEPFETGYGYTSATPASRAALLARRAAITSIKIDGAMHEFATVEGVVEDVTDIVLNLKKVKFKATRATPRTSSSPLTGKDGYRRRHPDQPEPRVRQPGAVDLHPRQEEKIPDRDGGEGRTRLLPGRREQEARAKHWRHRHRLPLLPGHPRPLRRRGSPRRSEDRLRPARARDLDRRPAHPDEALIQASAILQRHLDVFVGYDKNAVEFEEEESRQDEERTRLRKLYNMSVNEIELSVRAANCLNNANITTVGNWP